MSRRSESGFSLPEVMLVLSIALLILGGTLTSFDTFYKRSKQTQVLNDTAQTARNGMDTAARQLRNLANQDPTQLTTTIAVAEPYDLVFQTSDPSRKWVRYCLQTSDATVGTKFVPASPSRGRLWESETTTATPPDASKLAGCPGTTWANQKVVADRVTNVIGGRSFNVFDYGCSSLAAATCPSSAADYARITNIVAQIYVDPNPGKAPAELRTVSSIYLRNQNEKPDAAFVSREAGVSRTVILNASTSADPEGRTLFYDWFRGTAPISLTPEEACAPEIKQKANGLTLFYLGEGVTFRYQVPAALGASGSQLPIQLVVRDPGCLYDSTVSQVTIP